MKEIIAELEIAKKEIKQVLDGTEIAGHLNACALRSWAILVSQIRKLKELDK